MSEKQELEQLRGELKLLLNLGSSSGVSDEILRRIKDIIYLVDRTLVTVSSSSSDNVKKVIKPIYMFLKEFHDELKCALDDPNYTFKIIEEPELPDIDDFDDEDQKAIKNILDTIVDVLPTLEDLLISLKGTTYPYEREIAIIFNTIGDFCTKLSK